ncbi:MAG: prepilin-type N-terminal cleavage/methylation domain-containing protein [Phycisphaerae bacterium]|nr:prepilin-type N-terminal cleavage/methylation domain-containing protein [Gemmatimonadaceae bacterium]
MRARNSLHAPTFDVAETGDGQPITRGPRSAFTLVEVLAAMTIIGLLAGLAAPKLNEAVEQAKIARAIGDLRAMAVELSTVGTLPATLAGIGRAGRMDPWGRPYVYYLFPPGKGKAPPKGARKDRFLVPINSEYDLYSVGKDGGSAAPLTAKASHDDIIVANDGGFIGLAKKY